jgi:hypothetical protein
MQSLRLDESLRSIWHIVVLLMAAVNYDLPRFEVHEA